MNSHKFEKKTLRRRGGIATHADQKNQSVSNIEIEKYVLRNGDPESYLITQ